MQALNADEVNAIRSIIAYDPYSGFFTRTGPTLRSNGRLCSRNIGKRMIGHKKNGYLYVSVIGRELLAHRLAFVLMGSPVPRVVDHINGIKTDNRWLNLRPASFQLNGLNRHNKIGASQDLPIGVWRITHNGRAMFRAAVEYNGQKKTTKRKNLEDAIAYADKWKAHFISEALLRREVDECKI